MPLFAYACRDCNAEFEALVRASDVPACPSCGSQNLQQQIARVSGDIKHKALAQAGRRAAAREGHVSNFSAKEAPIKKG
ncbi:FmdB family zinc ribbon protein [Methylocella silvestris]|uniref:FmdB family transcriptional regulator n=1 Tax=Methylocella silvestris TaxID=199596 RepID=A0A2J7TG68_METSI|nr:zinc ribbon domain-containing protein [Methylocella silvestris]PNG25772.1 FmdB family transcriptional regulator [Methylocella silvestris]